MIGTLSTLLPTSSRIGGSADASRAALRVVEGPGELALQILYRRL